LGIPKLNKINLKLIGKKKSSKEIKLSDWELDFYSRPILDERGKKLWELLVTDSKRSFIFSEFFRNNKVNSTSLKLTITKLISEFGIKKPSKCHFFRNQSLNIVTRALNDLEIRATPSRRCPTIMDLLEERLESIYKQHPGYCESSIDKSSIELLIPKSLPSKLKGEVWAFVQLSTYDLKKEVEESLNKNCFGSTAAYLETLYSVQREKIVPGVVVFSKRSIPLSAWTNSLELASIYVDMKLDCLVLESGVNQKWVYGSYRKSGATNEEARAWERSKKAVKGLHFLAIQPSRDSDTVSGLWLMQTRGLPKI
jgi:hypothetical protein